MGFKISLLRSEGMQSTEANNPGKRVVFIAIGLILLGLVVFGVIWAKNRADQYSAAESSQPTTTETETTSTTETTVVEEGEVAGATDGQDSEEAVSAENTAVIPAAGATDTLLTAAMLAILAFSITKFVQSEVLAKRL